MLDQVIVEELPDVIDVGEAEIVTVGALATTGVTVIVVD